MEDLLLFQFLRDNAQQDSIKNTDQQNTDKHLTEENAKYLVQNMYHIEGGETCVGELFDINKAKMVCQKYRSVLPKDVTYLEVYVAINLHYHDYKILYKSWFKDNYEWKIIDSAIIFWFKDDDCKYAHKLMHYLCNQQ